MKLVVKKNNLRIFKDLSRHNRTPEPASDSLGCVLLWAEARGY